jgi:hypothetical protein
MLCASPNLAAPSSDREPTAATSQFGKACNTLTKSCAIVPVPMTPQRTALPVTAAKDIILAVFVLQPAL